VAAAETKFLVFRIALRYSARVIREFRHKVLRKFFETGSKAGIQPKRASKLHVQLGLLDVATKPAEMDVPGWELHALKGELAGQWSVWVNGNWRLTFAFEGEDAVLVDYQDYH
jgi:toxin HigB-1